MQNYSMFKFEACASSSESEIGFSYRIEWGTI